MHAQNLNDPAKFGIDIDFGLPTGLNNDVQAPEFAAYDTNGNLVKLSDELKNGPVVLVFYRGEWCPVCNKYLSNFQDSLKYIEAAGATVFAITPESKIYAEKTIGQTNATFIIIPDLDETIMKNYDVLFTVTDSYDNKIKNRLRSDIAANNAKDDSRLPVPATYIINSQGEIVYRQFDLNYRNRATVKQIIRNIPEN
jgi:peroxiredoxin